jgi:hypothetical protein
MIKCLGIVLFSNEIFLNYHQQQKMDHHRQPANKILPHYIFVGGGPRMPKRGVPGTVMFQDDEEEDWRDVY